MSKESKRLAYDAGRAFRITPNENLPDEAVADPVAACPFPVGDEQRAEWLRGYSEAHEQENTQAADIDLALRDELEVTDSMSGGTR